MNSKPLHGILVVDLSRYLPGPLTAKMLANLGARVIKIEEPEFGDPVRQAPPFSGGASALGRLLLSGVESVALDLKQEPAREVLRALLAGADVLVESFRPGKLADFGLTEERLGREFPRLVVCSVSGWGQSGPLKDRSGHDLTYQAAAGALAATAAVPNLPTADLLGALAAVAAVNAALLARAASGRGARIDASLFDAAMVGNLTSVAAAEAGVGLGGEVGGATGLTGAYPCYRLYATADGRFFALAALEPHFWKRFCDAVERPDLASLQFRRDGDSHRRLEDLFASRSAADWSRLCLRRDLPGEVVLGVAEAARSPQAVARDLGQAVGRLPYPAMIDAERPEAEGKFPALGEHTRAVLAQLCPDVSIRSRRRLRRAGIGRRFTLRQFVGRWVASRFGG